MTVTVTKKQLQQFLQERLNHQRYVLNELLREQEMLRARSSMRLKMINKIKREAYLEGVEIK